MIMTINEIEHKIKVLGGQAQKARQYGGNFSHIEGQIKALKWVLKRIQPNTTSTDIEEVRKEFKKKFGDNIYRYDSFPHGTGAYTTIPEDIWEFFTPHLSNKSELQKEAVEGFAEYVDSIIPEIVGVDIFIDWSVLIDDYLSPLELKNE